MSTSFQRRRPGRAALQARGFSLIEILIGVAIGLIAVLVIFQTFSVFGTRARTTTSGSDAQVSGTLGLFTLERDLRLAGLGFGRAQATVVGCTVNADDAGRVFSFSLVPVQIVQNATAGGPVTLNVLYGNSSFYSAEQTFTASTATSKTAVNRTGFQLGDLMVVATPSAGAAGPCALVEVTGNTNADGLTVDHASTSYVSFYGDGTTSVSSRFNPSAGPTGTFTAGTLYNLGPDPRRNSWTITSNRILSVSDLIHAPATALDVAEGIVNLQAEYGLDTDGDSIVDSWTTTDPTAGNWLQVRAIRVAILARSEQLEPLITTGSVPTNVTTVAPRWSCGSNAAGCAFAMTDLNSTSDSFTGAADASANNWRNYRYRVYEKVIPLRNMIWGTAP